MNQPDTRAHRPNWRSQLRSELIAFPLLTRELIEQSARKRTYIIRAIYAAVLYAAVLWIFWNELGSWSSQSFSLLGRGRELFDALSWLQFSGVYLFLPAITSGVLTVEKERDTLSLLLLTRLGPWSILLGKLLSRLIPMASFILLSLPLIAVAYSLGGIESREIVGLAWSLLVTSVQVGSLALACSCWCRTTAGAFMMTYIVGALIIGGFPLAYNILDLAHQGSLFNLICDMGTQSEFFHTQEEVCFVFFGPWLCLHPETQGSHLGMTIIRSIPILMFTGACLALARATLWSRAFLKSCNPLLNWFRYLDKTFHRLNQNRLTRGIVLTHEDVALPLFDPIRWRETRKRSLGTTRYLIRMLVILEFPLLFGILLTSGIESNDFLQLSVSLWLLWIIATLALVIQSTGLIGLEKSRQTLDVLLTVPMTSDEIVKEKLSGVWRMIRMLWIPFLTVYAYQFWWIGWVRNQNEADEFFFLLARNLLTTAIYMPLIVWMGFHLGMRCRSQTQAVLVTLSAIAAICAVPTLAHALLMDGQSNRAANIIKWLSPVTVVSIQPTQNPYYWNAAGNNYLVDSWLGLISHCFLFSMALVWLWWKSLKLFAVYVDRNDGVFVGDDNFDNLSRLRQKVTERGAFDVRQKSD